MLISPVDLNDLSFLLGVFQKTEIPLKLTRRGENGEKYANVIFAHFFVFFKPMAGFTLSAHTNVNSQEIQVGRE